MQTNKTLARRTSGTQSYQAEPESPKTPTSVLLPAAPTVTDVMARVHKGTYISRYLVQAFSSRYELSAPVGEGNTADFHVARRTPKSGPGELVGLKAILTGDQTYIAETVAMLSAESPLVPRRVFSVEDVVYLEVPLCDGDLGSAAKQIHAQKPTNALVEAWVIDVLRQVSKRLEVLHAHRYAHRDIKPANILFKLNGEVFLGDFGSASDKGWGAALLATPGFMAPDLLSRGDPGIISDDIWALAVTGLQLVMNTTPFDPDTELSHLPTEVYREQCFGTMRELMDGYLRYHRGTPAQPGSTSRVETLRSRNESYFAEFDARAPRLAPLLREMLAPQRGDRPSAKSVFDKFTTLAAGSTKPRAAWTYVHRDARIERQIDFFSSPQGPPLRRSTTYDGPRVPMAKMRTIQAG